MSFETNGNGFVDFFKKAAGVLLIILGTLGLFLPFLQGIAMILAGLALLGNKKLKEIVKSFFEYIKKKFSKNK